MSNLQLFSPSREKAAVPGPTHLILGGCRPQDPAEVPKSRVDPDLRYTRAPNNEQLSPGYNLASGVLGLRIKPKPRYLGTYPNRAEKCPFEDQFCSSRTLTIVEPCQIAASGLWPVFDIAIV